MDVFIYFSERLSVGIDVIEDTLEEALDGIGEVTGSGTGEKGSNIDVEVEDSEDVTKVISLIKSVLKELSVPESTTLVVDNVEYRIVD
ncbi:hypothetical protein MACH09_41190 [Vibrio sp. MACH09]|uniref:hypothetical protein n=1 Tax=Vibrio sp. MACH09 TaxID=3025122 RepID=UPI00278ED784|nr:hypothetical protein [Vibrio sp. MACH09]GLO63611.1 hypothetical protein MACH09_41190 [Vibrio sp. MACH09]